MTHCRASAHRTSGVVPEGGAGGAKESGAAVIGGAAGLGTVVPGGAAVGGPGLGFTVVVVGFTVVDVVDVDVDVDVDVEDDVVVSCCATNRADTTSGRPLEAADAPAVRHAMETPARTSTTRAAPALIIRRRR